MPHRIILDIPASGLVKAYIEYGAREEVFELDWKKLIETLAKVLGKRS